ncbi:hypothetical protein DPX39_070008400 [Trypanosoma brucei equiperdum]|uniref:Variant surface glycoprotein n=1 Tax=Trypanosoma brucei equiperdum TaxID=630700 RepID=A0A3L6L3I5_9TRYP|nr:hypothetical protein DPX39_070008400 [Trypanosoma brucei equiperdum]
MTSHHSETSDTHKVTHISADKIGSVLFKATKLKIGKTARLVLSAPTKKVEGNGALGTRCNWKQTTNNAACEVKSGAASGNPAAANAGVALHIAETQASIVGNELDPKPSAKAAQRPISAANVRTILIQGHTTLEAGQGQQHNYKQPPKKVSEATVQHLSPTIQAQRLAAYLEFKEGSKIKL